LRRFNSVKMFFGFTLRVLTKGSLYQQSYLDARKLKSTLDRAKQSNEAGAVARRELRGTSFRRFRKRSLEEGVSLALELRCFVARQETRKPLTRALESYPTLSTRARAREVRKGNRSLAPGRGFVSRHDRLARKTGSASQNFSANAVNHYEVPMVTPTPRPRPDATVFEIAYGR
jgi:hypothetical protein